MNQREVSSLCLTHFLVSLRCGLNFFPRFLLLLPWYSFGSFYWYFFFGTSPWFPSPGALTHLTPPNEIQWKCSPIPGHSLPLSPWLSVCFLWWWFLYPNDILWNIFSPLKIIYIFVCVLIQMIILFKWRIFHSYPPIFFTLFFPHL